MVSVDLLKANPGNPRTHSPSQIKKLARSLEKFGFGAPLIMDDANMILAGHGRLAAAKLLGLSEIPVICIEHLSPAEKRAYVLADNRIAAEAGWDERLLALEFESLVETDFDLSLTGFEIAEIDRLLLDGDEPEPDVDSLPAGEPGARIVTYVGDLWRLGKHRLLCGNALQAKDYARLMDGDLADACFTDPPYNVPVQGHVSGLGKARHREFAMASGELSEAEFTNFLAATLGLIKQRCRRGAVLYVCMDWRHQYPLVAAARQTELVPVNLCVWVKSNGGMGSFYRSRHELVFVYRNGADPHTNTIQLGKHGRYRTNVWEYAGANTFRAGRANDLAMHPTVKPTALVSDAIRDCTRPNDLVLDPFAGSGTTVIAAEITGRRCAAMELDPAYVDTIIRRWEAQSGQEARLVTTNQTFAEVRDRRQSEHTLEASHGD
ncbi:MAG: DNA methyltransferase [Alphaproteobacteria bacterium]